GDRGAVASETFENASGGGHVERLGIVHPSSSGCTKECSVRTFSPDGTALDTTVSAPVPEIPSLVAVRVTGPPTASAVATPVLVTLTTDGLFEVHVTVRPVNVAPPASRGTASI